MNDEQTITEIDLMRIRLAGEQVRRAVAELRAAERAHADLVAAARELQRQMVIKYGLREGDGFSLDDGAIVRADNGQSGAATTAPDTDEAP